MLERSRPIVWVTDVVPLRDLAGRYNRRHLEHAARGKPARVYEEVYFLLISRVIASHIHETSYLKQALALSLRAEFTTLRDPKIH